MDLEEKKDMDIVIHVFDSCIESYIIQKFLDALILLG